MSPAAASEDSEASSFDEYTAVEAAIQPYIQAARIGDGKSTSTYFEHAHIVGSSNGKLTNMDLETFENTVSSLGPATKIPQLQRPRLSSTTGQDIVSPIFSSCSRITENGRLAAKSSTRTAKTRKDLDRIVSVCWRN
jgi:hypothetical protein